ncbi:MAG: cysteine synthase A [Patulibacter sp.]
MPLRAASSVVEVVGQTPVVALPALVPDSVELFGKLEALNPGGSVKDRIGIAMLQAAERDGQIEPGKTTIVEATSGNTGIALAFACAAKGYELVLTLPQGMSREREVLLRLYGAKLEIIESLGGMTEAVEAARRLADSGDAFLPDQFSNPANPAAHEATTGPELFAQLDGKLDVLVCGVGTGGTLTGTGRHLKARLPQLEIVAVEPASSPVLSGGNAGPHRIQGIGAGFVPPVLERELIDEIIAITDDDAIDTAWLAARRCGVLAGLSCGAALAAAIQIGQRPESRGKRIAVILPDSGERYSSTPFFVPPTRRLRADIGAFAQAPREHCRPRPVAVGRLDMAGRAEQIDRQPERVGERRLRAALRPPRIVVGEHDARATRHQLRPDRRERRLGEGIGGGGLRQLRRDDERDAIGDHGGRLRACSVREPQPGRERMRHDDQFAARIAALVAHRRVVAGDLRQSSLQRLLPGVKAWGVRRRQFAEPRDVPPCAQLGRQPHQPVVGADATESVKQHEPRHARSLRPSEPAAPSHNGVRGVAAPRKLTVRQRCGLDGPLPAGYPRSRWTSIGRAARQAQAAGRLHPYAVVGGMRTRRCRCSAWSLASRCC